MDNLSENLEIFKIVLDSIPFYVIITDPEGIIVYANEGAVKITGFNKNEMIGKNPKLWGGQMEKGFYQDMWKTIKEDKINFISTMKNKRKNGQIYDVSIKITPLLDVNGNLLGFCSIEQDMTDILKTADEFDINERQKTILARTMASLKDS